MSELWTHSRRVAAMAHALANRLSGFDPDIALLAGLLHDIGTLVVINTPAITRRPPRTRPISKRPSPICVASWARW